MNLIANAKKSIAIVMASTFICSSLLPMNRAFSSPGKQPVQVNRFLAAHSLFALLTGATQAEGRIVAVGAQLRKLLDIHTPAEEVKDISQAIDGEISEIERILSAAGGVSKIRIRRNSAVLNKDGSVEFVIEYREGYRPDKVAIKYTPASASIAMTGEPEAITGLLARAVIAQEQRQIDFDNLTKGEHVDHKFLSDESSKWKKTPINTIPQFVPFIREAIRFWKRENSETGDLLDRAFRQNRISVVDVSPEMTGAPWTLYSRCDRRMRYAFLYTRDNNIYIPRHLIEAFLDPSRMEQELKEYVGDDNYRKIMAGKSLEERLVGALGHDAYEGAEALRLGHAFNVQVAHARANQMEQMAAGRSVVSPAEETGFDDISKLLLLKSLGMAPSIQIFDILRDHTKDYEKTEDYAFGFNLVGLRDIEDKDVKTKLESVFGDKTRRGEKYYILSQKYGEQRHAIAIVKRGTDGKETTVPIYKDIVPTCNVAVNTLIEDYQFFKNQPSIPKEERLFLAFVDKDFVEGGKEDVDLLGGKGSSLAEMARKVPVPAGVTATAKAYYKFLDANPELKEFLREKMASIDVKNNTERGKLAREIQERMSKAVIPDEIVKELTTYYRHLNIQKGNTAFNTPVADRTSGVLEDIAAELPWFKHTSGSQAGQGDTFLNCKGIDNVAEKLRDCWVSLFTDRAISYRDDQWFLMLADKLGEDGYRDLTNRLKAKGLVNVAGKMTMHESPGYINLKTAVEELLTATPGDEKLRSYAKAIGKTADLFINPEKLGIAVVVMNMVKSEWSFVAFTVSAVTGFAGKDMAKWQARQGDDKFVRRDAQGNIIGTKPNVVQVESNWGYGETVVGGMVTPDKVVLGTLDGEKWFILEKDLGTKIYRMIDIEEGFRLLSDQMQENRVRVLAKKVKDLVAFAENDVRIAKLIKGDGDLLTRLKNPDPDRKKNEKRIQDLAKQLAPLAEKGDRPGIIAALNEHFDGDVANVTAEIIKLVEDNKAAAERGQNALAGDLLVGPDVIDTFKQMILAVWGNADLNEIKDKDKVLKALGLKDIEHFRQMAFLFRSLKEGTFTVLMDTPAPLREKFTFPNELIAHVASLAQTVGEHYEDDRDLEGAAEITPGGEMETALYDLEGHSAGKGKMKTYNLQARPYTAKTIETDLRRDVFVIDEKFIEKHGIQPVAAGAKGESAARGMIYVVDDTRDLGEQADEIARIMAEHGWKKENGEGIIAVIKFATPAHDPIMKIVAATVTYEGGETSHAAIFNREQGNPCIAGIGRPTGAAAAALQEGNFVVVDANNGKIYEDKVYEGKKIPVEKETIVIKPYLFPYEKGDTKSGSILGGTNNAMNSSPLTGYKGHYGNSLARMEFGIQAMGIYPTAAVAYDNHVLLNRGEIMLERLSPQEVADVEVLRAHPKIIEEIRTKIAGYPNAAEYVISKMEYIYNTLGFCLALDQKDIVRAYDNKENEVGDLLGANLYVHPGTNPLIEVRGSSLLIKPESKKPFGLLLEGLFRSIDNGLDNHGWMDVFVRTERELEQLLQLLEEAQKARGVEIKNVGIMVEVPSDIYIIEKLADQLVSYQKRHPGVKMFFSFGTNDLTNLAGKTDRDDPSVQNLKIMDLAIKQVTFSDGSKYTRNAKGELIIPLADEGSPLVQQMIENVVAVAMQKGIACGLCGQAIVKLIEGGNLLAAARIISVLDSFGTDLKNYVMANMIRYDAMSMLKKMDPSAALPAEVLALTSKTQATGVISGEVVFVNGPEDLISDEVKGLTGQAKADKIKFLRDNNPAKLSRVGNKIVVITGNIGNAKDLKEAGIEYIDLQYARAIIVDEGVDLSASDVFDKVKEKVIFSRVKGRGKDLAGLRGTLEGKEATIDYASGKAFGGIIPVVKEVVQPRSLVVPEKEADVPTVQAKEVSANDIFREIGIHPLMLLAYDTGELLSRDEYAMVEGRIENLKKVDQLGNIKRGNEVYLAEAAEAFGEKVGKKMQSVLNYYQLKSTIESNLKEEYKAKRIEKTDEEITEEAVTYLTDLRDEITAKISGYPSAVAFLKAKLGAAMSAAAKAHPQDLVVYRISNLTRRDFSNFEGGRLERINENHSYGLLGSTRSVSDFWKIFRLELETLKEVRDAGNKNLGLLLSDVRGVRCGAVLNANMQTIQNVGLVPGKDGFEVGINIAGKSDVDSTDGFAQEAITFIVFETRPLAGALFGANLARQEEIGITEDEIKGIVVDSRKTVKEVAQKRGLKWVELPARVEAVPARVPVELPPIFGPAVTPVPAQAALRSSGGFEVVRKPLLDGPVLVENAAVGSSL